MAAGFAISSKTEGYNGGTTVCVLLSCIVAAMGGLIFGYDIGISGQFPNFFCKFFFFLHIMYLCIYNKSNLVLKVE